MSRMNTDMRNIFFVDWNYTEYAMICLKWTIYCIVMDSLFTNESRDGNKNHTMQYHAQLMNRTITAMIFNTTIDMSSVVFKDLSRSSCISYKSKTMTLHTPCRPSSAPCRPSSAKNGAESSGLMLRLQRRIMPMLSWKGQLENGWPEGCGPYFGLFL